MVADLIDKDQSARCGINNLSYQLPIGIVMGDQVLFIHVHELNGKINPFTGRIRFFFSDDVLFPKNGDLVLHQQFTPASGVLQNGPSDDHPFLGFQTDLEGHGLSHQGQQWRLARG